MGVSDWKWQLGLSVCERGHGRVWEVSSAYLREQEEDDRQQQLTRDSNQEGHDVLSQAASGPHLVLSTIATLCLGDPQPGGAVGVADLVAPSEGDRLAVVIPRRSRQRAPCDRHFQTDHLVLLEYQAVLILAGYTNTRRRWEQSFKWQWV